MPQHHHIPAEVTRRARSSFYYAFLFLPPAQRFALDAVYAFCRLVDDAVDEAASPEEALQNLAAFRVHVEHVFAEAPPTAADDDESELVTALWWARRTFGLERAHFEAVLDGQSWDAAGRVYATWDELAAYCRRVGSAVGQLCVEIFGCKDPEARRYADELGLALQLTNILRDVDEDAARGRIYLPREDLESFHVSAEDLRLGRRTPNVMRLLRFEAQRARLHFLRARATQPGAERARLVVADIMGDIYYALLEGLEFAGFPHEKLRLGRRHRAALALRRYARARLDAA